MHDWIEKSKAAAHAIQARDGRKPQIGLILGSGLGGFADDVSEAVTVPFADIPHFPTSSVSGHAGQ
ncbi:MAG: purine-nucleoside phosphorylase, partial [Anaerolineales bacterium]|nr:purine-nucleoside phosphorylase [Anaerolineales bacterium]